MLIRDEAAGEALRPLQGLPSTLWTAQIVNDSHNFKIYSGFDEAVGLSGRSVSAILAGHWARKGEVGCGDLRLMILALCARVQTP